MNLKTRLAVLLVLVGLLGGSAVVSQVAKQSSDASLAAVRRDDQYARNARGVITRLPPEEHLRRASVYHANRAFEEARAHWQAFINYYPEDSRVAEALLGIGRSFFQARRYSDAFDAYDRLELRALDRDLDERVLEHAVVTTVLAEVVDQDLGEVCFL